MGHQSSQDVFLLCFVDDERLLWLPVINATTFDHVENIRFTRDRLQSHTFILARADPDLVVSFSPLRIAERGVTYAHFSQVTMYCHVHAVAPSIFYYHLPLTLVSRHTHGHGHYYHDSFCADLRHGPHGR